MDRSALTGLAVALAALFAATGAGLWWRRRDGRVLRVAGGEDPRRASGADGDAEQRRALAALGAAPGPVTLLQFSSAFCAPCRVARRLCDEVAGRYEGVVHIEIDAESHLDEVRQLGIWRTPTVLVLDTAGRVVHRATGAPARQPLAEAVASLLPVAS